MKKIYITLSVLLGLLTTGHIAFAGLPTTFTTLAGTTITYNGPTSVASGQFFYPGAAVGATTTTTFNMIDLGASIDINPAHGGLNIIYTNSSWGTCNYFGITYSNLNLTNNAPTVGISGYTAGSGVDEYHLNYTGTYVGGVASSTATTAGLGTTPTITGNKLQFFGTAWVPYYAGKGITGLIYRLTGTAPTGVIQYSLVDVRVTISAYKADGTAINWIQPTGNTQAVFNIPGNFYINVLYETDQYKMCNAMADVNTTQYCTNGMCNPTVNNTAAANQWYASAWLWKTRHGTNTTGVGWTSNLNMAWNPEWMTNMTPTTLSAPTVTSVLGCTPLSTGTLTSNFVDASTGVPGNNTITWTYSGVTGFTAATGLAAGTTSSATVSNTGSGTGTGTITYKVTNGACILGPSPTTTVTVRPTFNPGTLTAPTTTVCTNGTPAAINVTPTGGTGPYNIQWQSYNSCTGSTFANDGSAATGVTTSSITPPTTLNCQKFYQALITDAGSPSCGTSVATNKVSQKVYPAVPAPTATNTAAATGLCNGGSATVRASGLAPGGYVGSFDGGVNSYINLGTSSTLQITGSQTIEMWVYPTDLSVRRNLYAKASGGEGTITQEIGGTLNYYYGTSGTNTGTTQIFSSFNALPANQWSHIAIVRDLSAMKLYWYINGNLDTTVTALYAAAAPSTFTAYIGYGNTAVYVGKIDNVRIWNAARTMQNIRDNMYLETPPITTNLVALYTLNNNYLNSSGSGPNGTNAGGMTTPQIPTAPAYYTYTWASSGTSTASFATTPTTSETATITVTNSTSSPQTATVTVYAKTPASCDLSSNATGSTTIKADPIPGLPIVGNTTVTGCGSAQIQSSVGTNASTNHFYGPNSTTLSAGAAGTTLTVSTVGTATYYVASYNDTCGCEGSQVAVTVTVTAPFSITMGGSSHNGAGVSCVGSTDGTVTATSASTNYPLVFTWSTGTVVTNTSSVQGTSSTISGLAAGTYYVTISDAGGCNSINSQVLTSPTAISSTLTSSSYSGFSENCSGASVGTITTVPSGGSGTLTYTWTGSGYAGSSSQNLTGLAANTYNLVIHDANGCTASNSITLTAPAAIAFTSSVGFACSGGAYTSGSITISASGGASGVYQYSVVPGTWSAGNTFSGLAQGNYTVQVRDNTTNTCLSSTAVVNITFPAAGSTVGDCNFVYVSASGDPSNPGTKACPTTLTTALTTAATSSRNHILMQNGTYTYTSTIVIPALSGSGIGNGNIVVEGGYDGNWIKSSAAGATTLRAPLKTIF